MRSGTGRGCSYGAVRWYRAAPRCNWKLPHARTARATRTLIQNDDKYKQAYSKYNLKSDACTADTHHPCIVQVQQYVCTLACLPTCELALFVLPAKSLATPPPNLTLLPDDQPGRCGGTPEIPGIGYECRRRERSRNGLESR